MHTNLKRIETEKKNVMNSYITIQTSFELLLNSQNNHKVEKTAPTPQLKPAKVLFLVKES